MYIHADMPGSGTLLLALDGIPVSLVVEADTCGGWLRRYDTRSLICVPLTGTVATPDTPDRVSTGSMAGIDTEAVNAGHVEFRCRVASCPIVRVEGRVDFIGDAATDPAWMISQRLAAIRVRHGLPTDAVASHDTSSMVALVLERLASQLRCESMVAINLRQSKASDKFPMPDGQVQCHPTGRMNLSIDYESPDAVRLYEAAKNHWARQNPELLAEHVRSATEGEARVVEATDTSVALRRRYPRR